MAFAKLTSTDGDTLHVNPAFVIMARTSSHLSYGKTTLVLANNEHLDVMEPLESAVRILQKAEKNSG